MQFLQFDQEKTFTAIILDITERIKSEKALQQSEEKFRRMVEGAADPIFIQTDWQFAYLNRAACRIFGIQSVDVLIGTSVMARFHPDYHERIMERIRRLNEDRKSVDELMQQKFLRIDGGEVWVETTGEPIVSEGKAGALVFVREITERIEAEQAIREREEKFRQVFEAANVGKSITRVSGEVDVNRAFAQMLGYTQEELQGKTWQDLTPLDEIEPTQALLAPLLEGNTDSTRLVRSYLHKNGSRVWADVSVALHRDDQGKPLNFITTIVDITAQKKAEDDLLKLKDDLQAEVLDRTRELQEQVMMLERFHDATIQREIRMKELRDEIAHLKGEKE